jgi:predicted GIY-YIG superfamily endonuclease
MASQTTKEWIVYRILNTSNGRFYIGSSGQYHHRVNQHKNELIAGTHRNFLLNDEFKQYGMDVYQFRVLFRFDTRKEMLEREQLLIKMYWGTLLCVNIDPLVDDEKILHGFVASHAQCGETRNYLSLHAIKTDLRIPKSQLVPLLEGKQTTVGNWNLKRLSACETSKDERGKTQIRYGDSSLFEFSRNRHSQRLLAFIDELMQPEFSESELYDRMEGATPSIKLKKKSLTAAVNSGLITKRKDQHTILRYRLAQNGLSIDAANLMETEKPQVAAIVRVMVPVFSGMELYIRSNARTFEDFYKFRLLSAIECGLICATLPGEVPHEEQLYSLSSHNLLRRPTVLSGSPA